MLEYRFAINKPREHFASSRVLYNAKGAAPFPVRLADKSYSAAFAIWKSSNPDLVWY